MDSKESMRKGSSHRIVQINPFYPGTVFYLLLFAGLFSLAACDTNNLPLEFTKTLTLTTATLRPQISPTTPAPTNTYSALQYPTEIPEPTSTITPNPHHYFFPVRPGQSVDYAEGTAAHGYPAIDIFAPLGWEYVAVTDGVVEFVSFTDQWDPATDDPGARGGIAIAIIGDDGMRYYGSHLLSIAEGITTGQRVSAGQLLGYIGKSGNARSTISHLHFGISRPTYPEDWKTRRGEIDPFPYLNAWAAGIHVTPRYTTPTPKP
jgi:murein DD-endopeptidase MepM/ murein hydrolase activator NlpD